jgi:hypothetical protein
MAIKGIKRFKDSNGGIYKSQSNAIESQKNINKSSFNQFQKEVWEDYIGGKTKDKSGVWYGIIKDEYTVNDFELVFAEIFVKDSEGRATLIKLLTEIVHEEGKSIM